ncbi:MAG: hypothetical protein Q8O25_00530 [Sulfurisoma sp.]|nr:hypothetical protein [Sulfurisoma sp.]
MLDTMREKGIGEASRVMGSRAKLTAALSTATIDEVINIKRPQPYWVGRAGVGLESSAMSRPFEIAKSGGQHHGTYDRYKSTRTPELEKSIRSFRKKVELHHDKIANPDKYAEPEITQVHKNDLVTRCWPKEIEKIEAKIAIMEGIIKERSNV